MEPNIKAVGMSHGLRWLEAFISQCISPLRPVRAGLNGPLSSLFSKIQSGIKPRAETWSRYSFSPLIEVQYALVKLKKDHMDDFW